MDVPDQYRADFVLRELREFESRGEFPQLVLICLPNDHTSGTKRGCPTPAATVADNDLAFARIVAFRRDAATWKSANLHLALGTWHFTLGHYSARRSYLTNRL